MSSEIQAGGAGSKRGGEARAVVHIVGAGPSGLAAAIVAARAGRRVIVSERHRTVGARFRGDFQGLENWSVEADALEEFRGLGIAPTFDAHPISTQVCFGPDGREHRFRSARPFYYLIRRGPGAGTLDRALQLQAEAAGVEIRFGEAVRHPPPGALCAWGPRRADVMTVGYLFETDLPDGLCYAGLGEQFAPGGYSYLLVHGGEATLAMCVFDDFRRGSEYLERTLRSFERRLSFSPRNVRRFGGVGNVFFRSPEPPGTARAGGVIEGIGAIGASGAGEEWARVGESNGTQDALWGFGNRFAVVSGALAGRFVHGDFPAYRRAWEARIGRLQRTAQLNRIAFDRCGDHGYRWLLWRLGQVQEPWGVLHRIYAPAAWKRALLPLLRPFSRRRA